MSSPLTRHHLQRLPLPALEVLADEWLQTVRESRAHYNQHPTIETLAMATGYLQEYLFIQEEITRRLYIQVREICLADLFAQNGIPAALDASGCTHLLLPVS